MSSEKAKPRGRRRRPRKTANPTPESKARRVLRDLRALARDLAQREGLHPEDSVPVDDLALSLTVALNDPSADDDAAPGLIDSMRGQLREHLAATLAFRPGRAYCYQCRSAGCKHSAPCDPGETFAGFSATGKPSWVTFQNLCLQRKEPRVDLLFGEKPQVIALGLTGHELTADLMHGFGQNSGVYRVLGQVSAGLIPIGWWPGRTGDGRMTLTLQFVETHTGVSTKRLRLNIIGASSDDLARAAGNTGREPTERLRRLVMESRKRLRDIARNHGQQERRGRKVDWHEAVEPLVRQVCTDLEKVFRPHRARTNHAQQRHEGGARPTDAALRDAREAPIERLLHDQHRDTIVVLGPKGRAHVFSREGKHVTSLHLGPRELERKTKTRWKPLPKQMEDEWRQLLSG